MDHCPRFPLHRSHSRSRRPHRCCRLKSRLRTKPQREQNSRLGPYKELRRTLIVPDWSTRTSRVNSGTSNTKILGRFPSSIVSLGRVPERVLSCAKTPEDVTKNSTTGRGKKAG